jgi:uncharacterized membrane protein
LTQQPARELRRFLRGIGARRRFLAGILLSVAVFVVLPEGWRQTTRVLVAWNAGALLYLALVGFMMSRSGIADIRARAPIYDEARVTILLLTLGAIAASVMAIVVELSLGNKGGPALAPTLLAGVTIVLSWSLTHVVFAMHYAHEYYGPHPDGQRGGLLMPGNMEPSYPDFLYTAFVIGCATQTADVSFTSRRMRSIALAHGIVSFVFNTAILALTVNIAASVIGS